MPEQLIIKGGRVLDETGARDADVLIGDDGRILDVGADLDTTGHRVLDVAAGLGVLEPLDLMARLGAGLRPFECLAGALGEGL